MSKLNTTTSTTKPKATSSKPKVVKQEAETKAEPVVKAVDTKVADTTVTETKAADVPAVEAVEVVEADSLKARFERLVKSKQELIAQLKQEIVDLRKMQRDHEVALKEALKTKKKKSAPKDGAPRKPSGFASPVVVSDELYGFLAQLGVKKGEPIARTDVTRHVTAYIKQHNLQNPEARREIIPDAALKKLFGNAMELRDANDPKSPKVFTYLKLQRYLSPHFPKKVQNTEASTSA